MTHPFSARVRLTRGAMGKLPRRVPASGLPAGWPFPASCRRPVTTTEATGQASTESREINGGGIAIITAALVRLSVMRRIWGENDLLVQVRPQ
jgi:hypothetical protein